MTIALTCLLVPVKAQGPGGFSKAPDWPMFGQDASNTANGRGAHIGPLNVSSLHLRWTLETGGDVSARAAVVNDVAYFPDWGGNLWAVDVNSGKAVWSHQISDYGLAATTVSRTSPAVVGGVVYIATQYVPPALGANQPPTGWVLAINAVTGKLIWKMQPDPSGTLPSITSSLTVVDGTVYVGMTSFEEFAAATPPYVCCSARGSLVAVSAVSGKVLWQTFTVPAGYYGATIWGSNPVVDERRGTVFVSTGNNYGIPTDPNYLACVAAGGSDASCLSPDDHADSIIALDTRTGHVKWATRLMDWNQNPIANGTDFWNTSCFAGAPGVGNCPVAEGPDYDFGSAPNEITYQTGSGPKTIIGAGQKSGLYYALDPDTGGLLWQTQVGPGSALGGIQWGSASDGKRIYVAISNFYGIPGPAGNAGSWAALDPATGAILWQVADPSGAIDIGPLSVANGLVYVPSMAGAVTAPTMLALDASSGKTLWSFAAGASVNDGATIVGNSVYWGSGYAHLGIPGQTGNSKFYAFSVGWR